MGVLLLVQNPGNRFCPLFWLPISTFQLMSSGAGIAHAPPVVDPEAKRRKRSTANHFSRVKTQVAE
jgi:hypothetical protein